MESLEFGKVRPMLCRLAAQPHDRPGWLFERKYDGVRMMAFVGADGSVRLQARSGTDKTAQFPELRHIYVNEPGAAVLDGEVVSRDGLSFQDFAQRRMNRTGDINRLARQRPAMFVAFDMIQFRGRGIDHWTLAERRRLLHSMVPQSDWLRFPEWGASGTGMFEEARRMGWEGVVGKDLSQPYLFGKRGWLKVKVWREGMFNIVGYDVGRGKREGMAGSFWLENDRHEHVGKVGTGFDDKTLWYLTILVQSGRKVRFRVKYMEVTNDGLLRFPVYLGLEG